MKELERDERISAAVRSIELKNTPDDFDKNMAWDRLNQKLEQRKRKVVKLSHYRIAAGLLLLLLPASAYFLSRNQSVTPRGMEGAIMANKPVAAVPVHHELVAMPLQVDRERKTNLPKATAQHNNRKKPVRKNKIAANKLSPRSTNKNSEMGLMATTMISTPCLNTSPSRYMFN